MQATLFHSLIQAFSLDPRSTRLAVILCGGLLASICIALRRVMLLPGVIMLDSLIVLLVVANVTLPQDWRTNELSLLNGPTQQQRRDSRTRTALIQGENALRLWLILLLLLGKGLSAPILVGIAIFVVPQIVCDLLREKFKYRFSKAFRLMTALSALAMVPICLAY